MCLIVDANLAAIVFGEPVHDNFRPILNWLLSPKENGKLVVGGHLTTELYKVTNAHRFIRGLYQAGRVKIFPDDTVQKETKLVSSICESDDPHVIALAKVSGARILCSHDTTLHKDFTNLNIISPKGHIYQTSKHKRLLRLYGHTSACGEH